VFEGSRKLERLAAPRGRCGGELFFVGYSAKHACARDLAASCQGPKTSLFLVVTERSHG
jgi:hypothetical protein